MGGFYGSIHARTDDLGRVRAALAALAADPGLRFWLAPPTHGWTSVFPSASGQDHAVSARLAPLVGGDVFHLVVHDDDLFAYWYYRDGSLADRHDSDPSYFGAEVTADEREELRGHPERFA